MVKLGHTVTTLATTDSITYGRAGNPRDLSNFKVFVVCEPQNPFTANERKAIFNFVRAGGGLFMVGDHMGSDRDNDGWDSPRIWDSLGIKDSFGLFFDTSSTAALSNFSESSRSFNGAANDSIISGPMGHADTLAFHNGSALTLFTANNATAVSHFWRASNSAASMCASARFGQGKVVGIGDSSPADDSTGQSGNTLYYGWREGEDSIVFLNATAWLAAGGATGVELMSFTAAFAGGCQAVVLQWNTGSEQDSYRWVVERAEQPAGRYAAVGSLPAAGYCSGGRDYRYQDTDVQPGGRYLYRLQQLDLNGSRTEYGPVGAEVPSLLPRTLARVSPNPSRGQAVISYQLPRTAAVAVELFTVDGRRVAVYQRGTQGAGPQRFTLPAGLAAGTYLYRVRAGEARADGKLTIVR
ncbi:MAG TPA: T9SS type A sorting domain-containing protein, partial [Candidatus Edwardsbacteria bacterium]|nr:T9SS type A sorting domain-containing protein [Candidatus Edwardsbacteria bacterium]